MKLFKCIVRNCNVNVGLFAMYCNKHRPIWEYPLFIIGLKYPFIQIIKYKDRKKLLGEK